MSRIDDLLAELAPGGVHYVALSEIAAYSSTRIDAADLDEKSFVGVDNLVANKGGRMDAAYLPTAHRVIAYEPGDILLGNIRPYLRKVWLATGKGGCSGDVLCLRIRQGCERKIDSVFLYHVISSDRFFSYVMQRVKGAKMPRGDKESILKYPIPVPPLEVQREIATVLGHFTQLESELESELRNRRRQYATYRDHLIESSAGPRLAMGDIGSFVRGRRFTKNDIAKTGIPSIHYGEIYTDYGAAASRALREVRSDMRAQLRFARPRDVIFAGVGETVEDVGKAVAWMGIEPVAVHDDTFTFTSDLEPKYVSYAAQTRDFHRQKANYVARGKLKRLSSAGLARITIPVPETTEQRRIVGIIDDFDALVNDPNSGLPAEIASRRRQYEYYRDRLLTFEEASA